MRDFKFLGYFSNWKLSKGAVNLVMPMGAKPIGAETLRPKIVVAVSRLFVSTSIQGMIQWR
jgi:hypothetical protein